MVPRSSCPEGPCPCRLQSRACRILDQTLDPEGKSPPQDPYYQQYAALQNQKAVTAYFSSKQTLPVGFAGMQSQKAVTAYFSRRQLLPVGLQAAWISVGA